MVLPIVAALCVLSLVAGCSSGDSEGSDGDASDGSTSSTDQSGDDKQPGDDKVDTTDRPDGPEALIEGPLTEGNGVFLGASSDPAETLAEAGYVTEEFTAAGTATSYTGTTPADGLYELSEADTADYRTRIVVRRPEDPDRFNGVVVVEWLNVSGGVDAAPDYTYMQAELLREGYAWVGVSAQLIGIEGGPVAVEAPGAAERGAGKGLTTIDPQRYGTLEHPGDSYAFDIYTQIGRALRDPGAVDPLDGFEVADLLAIGESQSAFTLTTYYNGVQPLTEMFDGFLIHSRGGPAMPIEAPSGYNDIAASMAAGPTVLRDDLDTPALVVQTEGDLLSLIGYYPARQPDSEFIRIWEVAGSAHADFDQVGAQQEAALACSVPINRGQQVFVLRAALSSLTNWVRTGDAPPNAELLDIDDSSGTPSFVLDDVGNVIGGVRTPAVEAPLDVLSGTAPDGSSIICLLFGSTEPLSEAQLSTLYEDSADYLDQYTEATDAGIEAGFLLEADRDEIIERAEPDRVSD